MVRQKDSGPAGTGRTSASQKLRKKNRYSNDRDRPYIPPTGLVARPALPKSRYKTILEWTENTDKKKKLEIERTTNKNPNANFSFVPIGNPELTSFCKELSREQGALVYIVSTTKEKGTNLSDHVHRVGYHFRTQIVEQAISMVEGLPPIDSNIQEISHTTSGDRPDPIPETQEEINKQADAAIRDLYPRIPNTDREMIVRHAFQKGAVYNGKPVVGLQPDLTLARRVQLAVAAHVRHMHTRYDLLLRETNWDTARKTVESLCLDVLVKWRGDEETGRDQLDELLREIVIIDDSDDEDNSSEEESQSESGEEEEEEEEGSDGVTESNTDRTNASASAVNSQKSLIESQSHQPAKTQTVKNLPSTRQINSSTQNQSIASRTRSKTKPKKSRKARRNNKRYQAWQDALKRHHERPSATKTPLEPISRIDIRDVDDSHRPIQSRTPVGLSNWDLYTAPYTNDYQKIYAIDASRGPSKPMTHVALSQRKLGLSDFNYREKMLMSPPTYNPTSLEYRHGFDSRPLPSRPLASYNGGPEKSFAPSRRDLPPQDRALPSIEPAMDATDEGPGRVSGYVPTRRSQVMYEEVESERKLVPAHTNITYINDWEDNQPKRRRLVLADDQAHVPVAASTGDGYVHLAPQSRAEQSAAMAPSLRRVTDIRGDRERGDVPIVVDHRLGYPRYTERVADSRDQTGVSSMNEFRRPTSNDRESRLIIDDDSPSQVRMVRRAPGYSQPYSGELHSFETQSHKIQRVGDQRYFENSRPSPSIQDPLREHRLIGSNQPVQPIIYARQPIYQQGVAEGSSTSLSAFPSHPHPREMNSGLVSYPILSRPRREQESRFSSQRNEPVLVGAKSSHPHAQDRFSDDDFVRIAPQGREETRRPADFQVTRVGRHYIPVGSQGRIAQPEPHYIRIDPQDRVRTVVRQPVSGSGLNEVIVLSP